MPNDFDLSCIRVGTDNDLADTMALAQRLLGGTSARMDFVTRRFSFDLLVAVLMSTAYGTRDKTLTEVLFHLVDPGWECPKQIIQAFHNGAETHGFGQPKAAAWLKNFPRDFPMNSGMDGMDGIDGLVKRCHMHWTQAFGLAKFEANVLPDSAIEIFKTEAVAKAVAFVAGLDKKSDADLILKNARENDGYRDLPNAREAHDKLEKAKAQFENLVEPIARLQTDLILAAAMPPLDFRITPILLLGEPGIGKTFLATQLAKALGVSTDKISAGGAQGGFQLTGSHSTWTSARPGSLVALLAESKSASPVMVIDEVDKIGASDRYPVLPVLLYLLEPDTARKFRDQFLEMDFDASRVIFILTANSLEGVSPALLSRVEVFHVPPPGRAQRLRIIRQTNADLCKKADRKIMMDEGTCEVLASRTDLDLRKLVRLVREAFATALQFDQTLAELVLPPLSATEGIEDAQQFSKPDGPTWKYH